MFHWLHLHKRKIWITLTILLVPTFIYWGTGGSKSRSGAEEGKSPVVARVGDTPIYAAALRDRLQDVIERQTTASGQTPEIKDLIQSGMADQILESMINEALLSMDAQQKGYQFSREYLTERLKSYQDFKDERGNFDAALWNEFISRKDVDWNSIYAMVEANVALETLRKEIVAPAHVTEAEVRDQFEQNYTKIQVKYAAVDPKIEPTDEQIQEQYDKNTARYAVPESRSVEFAAISLVPPQPALVDDLLKRARAGEDFAALAKEFSTSGSKENGGDIGWVEENENMPDSIKMLFKTPVGQIADPIFFGGGYHIFKVEEEKKDDAAGPRSLRLSEIGIETKLDESVRAEKMELAKGIAAKVSETKLLNIPASEANVPVKTAVVSAETRSISGVAEMDTFPFIEAANKLAEGEVSDVVEGTENLYIIKVNVLTASVEQPLDKVKSKVRDDVIASLKATQEHANEVEALARKMADGATSLNDIVAKNADQNLTVKESTEFSRRDSLMKQGISASAQAVFDTIGDAEPGTVRGPLKGYTNVQYLFELIKKTGPSDEDWANVWPDEEKKISKQLLTSRQNQLLADYISTLRDKATLAGNVERYTDEIAKLFGFGQDADGADLDQPVAADDVTADVPASAEPKAQEDVPAAE